MDVEEFRKRGHEMVDFICEYYKNIGDYPVLSQVEPGYLKKLLPEQCPEEPESFDKIQRDLSEKIMPGVTHWQSPNFFAYFPGNSSFPGILGDMVSSMINCIGFNWICSPACTELEVIVLDWMARLLELPEPFLSQGTGGGVIQGTASEAVIVTMLAGRKRAMIAHADLSPGELNSKLVAYVSQQAHSSLKKASIICNVILHDVPTNDDFSMSIDKLTELIETDKAAGLIPFFVCGTVGTTNSGAFDNLPAIGKIANDHNLWFHVDAAWAGSACVCPEYRHLLNGLEFADSYNFNCHKWLLTNFDCSLLWVKNRVELTNTFTANLEILRSKQSDAGLVTDFRDWQLPLGRRFRSLKLWFVLRSYGVKGLQEHIRKHIAQGELFETLVKSDPRFELFVPRSLALVCFRLKASDLVANELNQKLEELANSRGIFVSHTSLAGQYVIRLVPGSPWTGEEHIRNAWAILQTAATELLA